MTRSDTPHPHYQKIYKVVAYIPHGSVATYGQIARLAGLPGQARMVGYALHRSPDDLELPWHRVINSRGAISFPKTEMAYDVQRGLLESEGIVFDNDRINLRRYQWKPEPGDLNVVQTNEQLNTDDADNTDIRGFNLK